AVQGSHRGHLGDVRQASAAVHRGVNTRRRPPRTLAEVANSTADGRIRVPADLDSVTTIGEEDHSEIEGAALAQIWQAARHWYQAGFHPAIQLCIRHHGRVVLNRAIGHGWGNAPSDPPDAEKVPVATDTPFC